MLPAIALAEAAVHAAPRASGGNGSAAGAPSANALAVPTAGPLQLKVRRLRDSVELVIEGAGLAPQLQQSSGANGWQGLLTTATPSGLRVGPQRLSLPELGFQTITLDGSGSSYRVGVTPVAGAPLGRPVVSGDGVSLIISFPASSQVSLPVARFNAQQPGYIPQARFAPPLQPRAVAPPLGDMAVGSMRLRNRGFVNVSGPSVTMTMKNAPAKDALMALAQLGGYGFVWVDNASPTEQSFLSQGTGASSESMLTTKEPAKAQPVTVSFVRESYRIAFNSVVLGAGLQAKLEGKTIFAGFNVLSKTFGTQLSKVYRLNQVAPNSAADYLANLGATVTKTNTIATSVTQGGDLNQPSGAPNSATTQSSSITNVEAYGASSGPLLGLRATTDTRLGTITLFGDNDIVLVAEQYLKQLDLRQRQVALNVRILDVNLDNVSEIDNSFAFRWGNNFIVNDSGRLLGAFGRDLPPEEGSFQRTIPDDIKAEVDDSGKITITAPTGVDVSSIYNQIQGQTSRSGTSTRSLTRNQVRNIERNTGTTVEEIIDPNTGARSIVVVPSGDTSNQTIRNIERILGRNVQRANSRGSGGATVSGGTGGTRRNPGLNYSEDFFDFVRAQIISGSTKLLASPTLILQENPSLLREGSEAASSSGSSQSASQGITNIGLDSAIGRRRANEGVVRVGTNVVTAYSTETPSQGGNVVCTPELSTAGLVLGARVEKIDDNGFVTFVLSPSVSAVTDQENAPQGCGSNLNILSIRSLDTGALRVRDGQTLIMTGVISDFDRSEVSKWPILGDIPLIGQFFRSSSGRKEKRELVIMVSPRIINDDQGVFTVMAISPGLLLDVNSLGQ